MEFLKVQSKQSSGATSSINVTVDPTTLDSLIVVNIKLNGITQTVTNVTDDKGNIYALALGPIDLGSGLRCYQFYGVQKVSGATTITITLSGSMACRTTIDEFTGGQKSNASVFDKASSGFGNAATSSSVTSFSPANANSLVVAGVGFFSVSSITAGSGYTLGFNQTNQATQYKLSSSGAETAPMTWTVASDWIEIAGIYKAYTTSSAKKILTLLGV